MTWLMLILLSSTFVVIFFLSVNPKLVAAKGPPQTVRLLVWLLGPLLILFLLFAQEFLLKLCMDSLLGEDQIGASGSRGELRGAFAAYLAVPLVCSLKFFLAAYCAGILVQCGVRTIVAWTSFLGIFYIIYLIWVYFLLDLVPNFTPTVLEERPEGRLVFISLFHVLAWIFCWVVQPAANDEALITEASITTTLIRAILNHIPFR